MEILQFTTDGLDQYTLQTIFSTRHPNSPQCMDESNMDQIKKFLKQHFFVQFVKALTKTSKQIKRVVMNGNQDESVIIQKGSNGHFYYFRKKKRAIAVLQRSLVDWG